MNNRVKWLLGIVGLLIIVNLALLATIWFTKKDVLSPPRPADAGRYLVETLSLTATQQKQFEELRKTHFERLHLYLDEMRSLKDQLFNQLKGPHTSVVDSLANAIGTLQAKLDLETFDHFSQLRAILTKEQAIKFDNVIQDVLRTMAPKQGPPPRDGNTQGPPLLRGGPPGMAPEEEPH